MKVRMTDTPETLRSRSVFERIKEHLKKQSTVLHYPVATAANVSLTEQSLNFSLPQFLKQCYLEIANGGFGPGLGMIGVDEGALSDYGTLLGTYTTLAKDSGGN